MTKTLYTSDVLLVPEGEEVELLGWIYAKRTHGGVVFLTLRDSKGILQIALKRNFAEDTSLKIAEEIQRESSVRITGVVRKDPRAPGGAEVHCRRLEVVGETREEFPIKKGVGIRFQLDHRHLHLRSPRVSALMKIRSDFVSGLRSWFAENGFYEVHCPTLVTTAVEGGATLFPVDYFGSRAYLTQSVQLYQEAAIFGLEKVYSIQPSFRAEKSRTRRHLTEYTHAEAEMAFASLEDIMSVQEELLYHSARATAESSARDLEIIKKKVDLDAVEPPYEKMTYQDAIGLIQSKGVKIEYGEDFGADEERVLSMDFEKPFFVTGYPRRAKGTFYHMPDPSDPSILKCADLLAPKGYGEIIGGGQRIHDYQQLIESIKSWGLNPADYGWYVDLRKYGSVPHSGFGLGVERTLMWLLGLNHVRDASLFPRTPRRAYP